MKSFRIAFAVLSLSGFAARAEADNAGVERAFLERSAISAADEACNLFTEGERFALKSGLYQTEGELLRANYAREQIDDVAAEVRAHAKSLGCDHPSVREVAATIRDSYRQFAKTNYIEYPGAHGIWRASRVEADQWALSEIDKQSGVLFGLRRNAEGKKPALRLAVALPAGDLTPSAAQLFIRDAQRLNEPWLGSLFGSNGRLAPAPRAMTRAEWAGETKEENDITGAPYQVYYFSTAALDRIEALDPRETVQLELTPPPQQKVQTPVRIAFEVGDLRAAHNFVMIPPPTYAPPKDAKH